MQWWGWLIVAVVVIAVLAVAFVAIQARRRKGGVIVGKPGSGPGAGPGGRGAA